MTVAAVPGQAPLPDHLQVHTFLHFWTDILTHLVKQNYHASFCLQKRLAHVSEKFGNPTATTVVTSAEGIPAIVTEGGVTKLVDVNGQVVKAAKLDLSVAGAAGDPDAMETTEEMINSR